MLLFRSEVHVERWSRQWNLPVGALLTLEQAWRLAQAWHGSDRRERDWRRRTVDETEALLKELGLATPFWNLR